MAPVVELGPVSIDAIARRIVELTRIEITAPVAITDADPWLTRPQAANYLSLTVRTFDRKRKLHAAALKPVMENPMRWSRNGLDVFKLTRGGALHGRPGRRPKVEAAA